MYICSFEKDTFHNTRQTEKILHESRYIMSSLWLALNIIEDTLLCPVAFEKKSTLFFLVFLCVSRALDNIHDDRVTEENLINFVLASFAGSSSGMLMVQGRDRKKRKRTYLGLRLRDPFLPCKSRVQKNHVRVRGFT